LYASAADVLYRYAGQGGRAEAREFVEKALASDPNNRRSAILAELLYTEAKDFEKLAALLDRILTDGAQKDDRLAAGLRLARLVKGSAHPGGRPGAPSDKATAAYEKVLAIQPGQPDALSHLAEAYGASESWDKLVALYEDQL